MLPTEWPSMSTHSIRWEVPSGLAVYPLAYHIHILNLRGICFLACPSAFCCPYHVIVYSVRPSSWGILLPRTWPALLVPAPPWVPPSSWWWGRYLGSSQASLALSSPQARPFIHPVQAPAHWSLRWLWRWIFRLLSSPLARSSWVKDK